MSAARGAGGGGGMEFIHSPKQEAKFKREKLQRRMMPLIAEIVADLAEQVGEQQLKASKPKRGGVLRGRVASQAAPERPAEGQALKAKGVSLKGLLRQFNALGPASRGGGAEDPKLHRLK